MNQLQIVRSFAEEKDLCQEQREKMRTAIMKRETNCPENMLNSEEYLSPTEGRRTALSRGWRLCDNNID
jgi:hypothetical protein